MDERQLVHRVIGGDAAAERELYDAHVDRIYRLMYRYSGDDDLAQEWTQETFIRAFDRLPAFRAESALSTWLYSIAVSVALNAQRKVKRVAMREVELGDAYPVSPAVGVAEPDLRERLRQAVAALPDGYRTVFVMHDMEGYTHEEIGSALGVRPGTSKAQLFRARRRLREALKEFEGEWIS
ncbi:MAG: RNA polymerase sigma factor [Gemmatimonadaceae bacterium]